jgi:hypothetical protein
MAKFKRLLKKTWEWAKPYFTWKMAPFLIIAWMITNGWSYVFVALGPIIGASWMTWIGGIWIGFLWLPFTIEKPITLFIAGLLYRIVYKEKFKYKGKENDN